jgi:hypothetical protein
MKRKLGLLALAGAMLLSAGPAPAGGDFYMFSGVGTRITSLPYRIDKPGFYYVTGNLSTNSAAGITIAQQDVTLDLMGFTLYGNLSVPESRGISIAGGNNIEVRNGTLEGWNYGVYVNWDITPASSISGHNIILRG